MVDPSSSVTIARERPDAPDSTLLIDELEASLAPFYPNESRHGYSVDQLITNNVEFFVVRKEGVPAACGGIQFFGNEYGELKRMYVRPAFRRMGLAKLLLSTLAEHARANGIHLIRLETGIHQHDAMRLYEEQGYVSIGPFGDYQSDPNSRFYEKRIG